LSLYFGISVIYHCDIHKSAAFLRVKITRSHSVVSLMKVDGGEGF